MTIDDNPLHVAPGKSVKIKYFGELIPNQLLIQNLSKSEPALFVIRGVNKNSKEAEWGYYGGAEADSIVSLLVNWPSTLATIENNSTDDATISIGGDGIFAYRK